jgi:LuxR family maltose regulon positive regulatory protein
MTVLSRPQTSLLESLPGAQAGRFFRPPLPAGHIPRPQLCERLAHGLRGRLLLISAPAGFGKSSLAGEFCESLPSGWRSLWLGLNARVSDPGRFFEYLLEGLRQFFPGLGEEELALLKMRQPHQPFAFEEWLTAVLDELAVCLSAEQPLLLVLDDYHLAQGSVLDGCLQFILNHLPAGLVLLVTSRQRPDWHLARLRLSQQLLEMQVQDLRLSAEESQALLSGHGIPLSQDAFNDVQARCEGWVAGLRLWLLARQEEGEPERVGQRRNADGLIHDYLLEEVIERQSAEVQHFLYQTAHLDRFCIDLCDAVREAHDSSEILAYLQVHQVFLVPLDERGKWFRYHHLFSDLLRNPDIDTGVTPATLHLRACRWFGAHGELIEAVEHALRAGRSDVAASLVQNLSEEKLLGEQNVAMLLRWKVELPDTLLSTSPRLIVLYGWALAMACQLDAAETLGRQLGNFLPAASREEQTMLLAQWLALSGVIARGRGELDMAEHYCREALDTLPADRYGQRFMCISVLANIAVARNSLWPARMLNREALELAQRIGNPLFEALAHYDRARVLQARGEITRALGEVRQGLLVLREYPQSQPYAVRARLHLYEGYLLALRLQPGEARDCLQAGIAEAHRCRDVSVVIGYCVLARLSGQAGKQDEAFTQLAEAERIMHAWDVPPIYYLALVTLVKCELWMSQGQLPLAGIWLVRLEETYAGEQAAAAPELLPQLPMHITLQRAALAIERGQSKEAEKLLRQLEQRARASDCLMIATMAGAHLCLLQRMGGSEREAQQQLRASLDLARGGAFWQFQPLIERQAEWLRAQLRVQPDCPVASALRSLLPAEQELHDGSEPTETLTARELSVLRLIAKGCSNQQISEKLFISLHTVKTHARHINSKLNVQRRTQAVARAKELGLLE